MKTSDKGLAMIGEREGVRQTAYKDSAGFLTIGVGHLLDRSELSSGKLTALQVDWHTGLTPPQVTDLLAVDVQSAEFAVNAAIVVPHLAQHQYDALVSFTFNVGGAAFRNSTLVKKINAGLFGEVPDQLRRWTYAGGKPDPILVKRRDSEIAQWLTDYV